VAAGLATAAVVLAIWLGRPASTAARIVVIAAHGAGSAELANGLAVDLAHLANAHSNAIVFTAGPDRGRRDYELNVAEHGSRSGTQADVSLFKTGSPDLIWSAAFIDGNVATVRQRIANRASNALECALHANGGSARKNGDQLRVLFSACERLDENRDDMTAALWRRAVARNPGNASALATLSYVEADFSVFQLPETKAAAWRTAAQQHLRKARAASTHLGLSYAAEAILFPASRYAERLAIVERGLALDPDCAVLHGLRSEYLHNVGRMDDALDSARAAVALAPDSAFARENLISALAYGGFARAAESELETAERIWPEAHALKDVRFRFDYRFGDAARLIRDIDEGAALPNSPMLIANGPERAFLLARAQPMPQNIDNAVALALKYARPPYQSLQSLVALGHKDQAYALMESPRMAAAIGKNTEILFRANMRPFVLDRRFMAFADRLGLVRYWLTSNAWPDFCEDKDVAYNCKAEARRLHPKPA
jgi:tetratricopeptide (TPR) repeat protein